ncbi:hypothetical protein TTHERM_00531940 (macronuclear) [Tetrahymena thermophila SB210]|uniref:Uncharacterized protein n=1 Tax=Tetrahymena thermophila (strain SB210) TaxID=312017 RepID=Q248H1_TETTS|nr:hypothetical protein TTHERM_00531940 [Tetrahymena thermophila SB210]EAS04074.2 hypothetical protein TTHERM_00531940 [Tetrahymena thermophila SB210]|eukprot:XP_001024319.2 hypothetical protein TTHERM_00531940 [Tetrahymena thermophila SB210]
MPPRFNQPEYENGFRIDDGFLVKNLFQTITLDKKKQHFLNINYLPHFQHSIKKFLSPEEKAALQDHQFQTFIIELSLNEVQLTDINQLRAYVLAHIKSCPSFWLQNSSIQKSAQIRHQASLEKQHRMEQWRKENPDRNIESYSESGSSSDEVSQKVKDQEQKQQKEDKNRVVQAMSIYNNYQEDIKDLKKKYIMLKNCILPEEYIIEKFERQENDSEEQTRFEEKVKKIRPNLNFSQGYYDTTTDQYQKQYKNSYSQYSSNSSKMMDEITEQTYFSYLRMKNIIVPDRFFKYPKIDFFIFPMVYQFIIHQITNVQKDIEINDEKNFRLQNFIFLLLLSEKQMISNQKRPRSRKSYFQEQDEEMKNENQKVENKLTYIKKDKTQSLIQNNDENDSENQSNQEDDDNDEDEIEENNNDENSKLSKNQSESSNQIQQEKEQEKKQTKNIKHQRSQFRNEYLDAFSNFCLQKFGFLIQNYYSSSLIEASKREKTLLFNTIKLGIDFYTFISSKENQNMINDENFNSELNEEQIGKGDQKQNQNTSKQRGKRKTTSKNKNYISQQLDSMEVVDYFTLKINETLVYYIKNYEYFIDNYQAQLKEYLILNSQAKQKQVIGAFSSQEQIDNSIKQYKDYLSNPDTLKMRGYLYHNENRVKWTEEQYKKFLELYLKYMKYPVNNRRIASEMGNNVHQNHVRFEKQPYMIGLRKRALENQIPLQDQVKRDIENFSLSYFHKNQRSLNNSQGSPSAEERNDNLGSVDDEDNDEINLEEDIYEDDEILNQDEDDEEEDDDDDDENNDDDEEDEDDDDNDDNDNDNGEEEDEDDDDDDDNEQNEEEEDEQKDNQSDDVENESDSKEENSQSQKNELDTEQKDQINKLNTQNQQNSNKIENFSRTKSNLNNKRKLQDKNTDEPEQFVGSKKNKKIKEKEKQKQKIEVEYPEDNQKNLSQLQISQKKHSIQAISDEEINLSDNISDLKTDELDDQFEMLENSSSKNKQGSNNKFLLTDEQGKNQNQKDIDELKINFSDDEDEGENNGQSHQKRKKIKQQEDNLDIDDDSLSL